MDEKSPLSVETSKDDEHGHKAVPIARNSQRILAFLIDSLFLNFVFSLVFSISQFPYIRAYSVSQSTPDITNFYKFILELYFGSFWVYTIFDMLLWASYFILFWRASGQTIGAKIMKILIIPSRPPLKSPTKTWQLSWYTCIVRFFLFYLSLQMYGIPFLFILHPFYNQRIHDFFSQTIVIDLSTSLREETEIE